MSRAEFIKNCFAKYQIDIIDEMIKYYLIATDNGNVDAMC